MLFVIYSRYSELDKFGMTGEILLLVLLVDDDRAESCGMIGKLLSMLTCRGCIICVWLLVWNVIFALFWTVWLTGLTSIRFGVPLAVLLVYVTLVDVVFSSLVDVVFSWSLVISGLDCDVEGQLSVLDGERCILDLYIPFCNLVLMRRDCLVMLLVSLELLCSSVISSAVDVAC